MKIIIDRIEGDFAVIEMPDKSTLNVPKQIFSDISEGDIYIIEKSSDKLQKEHIKKLSDMLFND